MEKSTKKMKRSKQDQRSVYQAIGHSTFSLKAKLPSLLKKLKKWCKVNWLRISMTYKSFPNIREKCSGDLSTRLNRDIISCDFVSHPCNCSRSTKGNGSCVSDGCCRSTCLVYKLTCKCCSQEYIGITQSTFKERVSGHCRTIQQILKSIKESSTLAKHFSQKSHWPNLPPNIAPTPYQIQQKLNFDVLYQGSSMTVFCHFGTSNCCICMHEK